MAISNDCYPFNDSLPACFKALIFAAHVCERFISNIYSFGHVCHDLFSSSLLSGLGRCSLLESTNSNLLIYGYCPFKICSAEPSLLTLIL